MGHEHFRYTLHKGDKVRIFWEGRCIMTIAGRRGAELTQELKGVGDDEAQYILQRVTGNFKRGNERQGRQR
jgi:hypothetical protein